MPQKQILGRTSSDRSPTIRSDQKTCGHNTLYVVFGGRIWRKNMMVKDIDQNRMVKKNVHMVFQVGIYAIYIRSICPWTESLRNVGESFHLVKVELQVVDALGISLNLRVGVLYNLGRQTLAGRLFMAFSWLGNYRKLAQLPKGGIARNNQYRSCTFLFGISSVLNELFFWMHTWQKKNLSLFQVKAIRGYNPMLFPKPCRSAKKRAMHGNQVAGGLHIALAGIFKHTTCCWEKMQIVGHCLKSKR